MNQPLTRFQAFEKELKELYLKHGICLHPSMYDDIQAWNIESPEEVENLWIEDAVVEGVSRRKARAAK